MVRLNADDAKWYKNEKTTAIWVKKCFEYLEKRDRLDGHSIYNLARLTWITTSLDGVSEQKWVSTHRPALCEIFELKNDENTADEDLAKTIGISTKNFDPQEIGIVNFYPAYRNNVPVWAKRHSKALVQIAKQAANASSNGEMLSTFTESIKLPSIPHPAGHNSGIRSVMLLSPLLACLDPREKTPILNGAVHVRELLKELGVSSRSLLDQFGIMQRLITPPITDGFLLDCLGVNVQKYLPKIETEIEVLEIKMQSKEYENKNEKKGQRDGAQELGEVKHLHNKITNLIARSFGDKVVKEGTTQQALYDLLVENYDGKDKDLLIEVKSDASPNDIHLAVGQLLDYQRYQKRRLATDLAVGLIIQPSRALMKFLEEQSIIVILVDLKRGKMDIKK